MGRWSCKLHIIATIEVAFGRRGRKGYGRQWRERLGSFGSQGFPKMCREDTPKNKRDLPNSAIQTQTFSTKIKKKSATTLWRWRCAYWANSHTKCSSHICWYSRHSSRYIAVAISALAGGCQKWFRTEPGNGWCLCDFWTIFGGRTVREYWTGIWARFGSLPSPKNGTNMKKHGK